MKKEHGAQKNEKGAVKEVKKEQGSKGGNCERSKEHGPALTASQVETRRPVWSAKCHWYVHLIWLHSVRDAAHLVWFIMQTILSVSATHRFRATWSAHTRCEPQ